VNARRSCRGFPTCLVLEPCRKERAQAWDSVAKAAKESVPAPGQDQIAARYRQFATLCLRSRRYLTLPISSQQAPSPSATSSRPQSRAGSRRVGVAKNLRAPRHATVGDVLGEAMELHSTSDEGRRDGIYNQREHGRRGSLSRAAPQRLVGGSSAAASNGDRMEVDEEPPSLSSAPAEPAQQQQQQQASVLTLVADIGRLELEEVGHRAAAREAITATTGTQTSGVPTPRELRAQARLDLQVVGLREEERRRQRLHAAATTRLVRELALKLSNPLRHFGGGAFIQLMMCEFVMRPEVQGRSGRSLGVAFRSQLLLVYEPSDVPTLPGLYSLDVLQASLNTPLLQRAALQAIDDVKLFSLHLPGVLGKVEPTEADSLLGLWQRAAEVRAAEARRPQRGRPRHRIEFALRQNMTGNRYSAALRKAVYLYRHKSGTERSISMRGAASLARDGATLLFDISDDDIARVRLPSAGTCSLIDRAVHRVQRMQEVEFTFSRVTYFVAFGHAQTLPPPPPLLAPPPPPPLSTARPPPALPAPPPPLPPPRPLAPPRMRPLAVLLAPPSPVRLPSPQKLGSASRGQS
jgi:hypothetical protein